MLDSLSFNDMDLADLALFQSPPPKKNHLEQICLYKRRLLVQKNPKTHMIPHLNCCDCLTPSPPFILEWTSYLFCSIISSKPLLQRLWPWVWKLLMRGEEHYGNGGVSWDYLYFGFLYKEMFHIEVTRWCTSQITQPTGEVREAPKKWYSSGIFL